MMALKNGSACFFLIRKIKDPGGGGGVDDPGGGNNYR
jgi:hypothetical protein